METQEKRIQEMEEMKGVQSNLQDHSILKPGLKGHRNVYSTFISS